MIFSFEKLLSQEAILTHMVRNVLSGKSKLWNDASCPPLSHPLKGSERCLMSLTSPPTEGDRALPSYVIRYISHLFEKSIDDISGPLAWMENLVKYKLRVIQSMVCRDMQCALRVNH